MSATEISDLSVAELMYRWPQTIRVFLDWRMHCVGCPIARFHTLADSAREHGCDIGELEAAILAMIERPTPTPMSAAIQDRRPVNRLLP
jgi:hybrid cluster-associated redox disulfide protein